MKNTGIVLLLPILISGCMDANKKFAADELFEQPIEKIDIISVLNKSAKSSKDIDPKDFPRKFDAILSAYAPTTELARNRVQDRLIFASNVQCARYKTILKRKQSRTNFWLGTAATTFGAAGAISTGAQAASNLSALSGLSSGVRAEYNQSYFSDLTAQVISKGISARRTEILQKIASAKTKSLAEYTIEGAIADAVTYHGACSLVAGLERADTAVTKLNNKLGLDELNSNVFFMEAQENKEQ